MLVEQLVTTVADGTVGVQGLSPNLDEELMYRLMNLAPSTSDMEDHYLPAYTYGGSNNGKAFFGRTYRQNEGIAQTNFIICPSDHLIRFQYNPALFAFISSASGSVHNKDRDLPNLPVMDYEDTASRFEPVFESEQIAQLAGMTIEEIQDGAKVAVLGVSHPFRFLIPMLALLSEEDRLGLTYSVNSSLLPKGEQIKLFVFPTISSTLLQHLEEAGIHSLAIGDVATA